MKWFRKQTAPAGASVQLRETGHHPFGLLGQYVPMRSGEIRLYRAVREAVPVVDAAIYKLIRMVGGVTAACSDPAAERGLGEFLRTVPAGRGQYGVNAFLEGYLDALLTCGPCCGAGWRILRFGRETIPWHLQSAAPTSRGGWGRCPVRTCCCSRL